MMGGVGLLHRWRYWSRSSASRPVGALQERPMPLRGNAPRRAHAVCVCVSVCVCVKRGRNTSLGFLAHGSNMAFWGCLLVIKIIVSPTGNKIHNGDGHTFTWGPHYVGIHPHILGQVSLLFLCWKPEGQRISRVVRFACAKAPTRNCFKKHRHMNWHRIVPWLTVFDE
jgi:hypothetical protein